MLASIDACPDLRGALMLRTSKAQPDVIAGMPIQSGVPGNMSDLTSMFTLHIRSCATESSSKISDSP